MYPIKSQINEKQHENDQSMSGLESFVQTARSDFDSVFNACIQTSSFSVSIYSNEESNNSARRKHEPPKAQNTKAGSDNTEPSTIFHTLNYTHAHLHLPTSYCYTSSYITHAAAHKTHLPSLPWHLPPPCSLWLSRTPSPPPPQNHSPSHTEI